MPPVKELHYFDTLFVPGHKAWTSGHIQSSAKRLLKLHVRESKEIDMKYVAYLARLATEARFSEDWYRDAFRLPSAQKRLTGEITPAYSQLPEAGISYMKSFLGTVKIIYLIREPLARALSQLRMNVRSAENLTAETQWRGWPTSGHPRTGRLPGLRPALEDPVRRVGHPVPPFRADRSDPLALLRDVEDFLSSPPTPTGG